MIGNTISLPVIRFCSSTRFEVRLPYRPKLRVIRISVSPLAEQEAALPLEARFA